MAQAIWKGWLSFGLVNIPVKLYPATKAQDVRFHEIDPSTGHRVHHRRIVEDAPAGSWVPEEPTSEPAAPPQNPEQRELSFEEVAKGYELPSGELVTLTREELFAIEPEQGHTIELEEFVDLADIDPVFFEKSYYLAPQQAVGAERAYALLRSAMEEANKIGIGRFVLRTKEHLAAVRPARGILGLETLFFADEVRSVAELGPDLRNQEISDRELKLARQVIDVLGERWDPNKHTDTYRQRVLELIEQKAVSERRFPPRLDEPSVPPSVAELMETLKASVEALKTGAEQQPQKSRRRTG